MQPAEMTVMSKLEGLALFSFAISRYQDIYPDNTLDSNFVGIPNDTSGFCNDVTESV